MSKQFIFIGDAVDYHKLKAYIIDAYINHDDDVLFAKNYCDGFVDALAEGGSITEDIQDEMIKYNHSKYKQLKP